MSFSKYFDLVELVPPEVYNEFGENSRWFLDSRMISLANFLREFLNQPTTVNNWDSGGTMTLRGFRPPGTIVGSKYSQHKFGRGFDSNSNNMTPQQIYRIILENEQLFLDNGLTALEHIDLTPTWLHCDVRYTGLNYILIVR